MRTGINFVPLIMGFSALGMVFDNYIWALGTISFPQSSGFLVGWLVPEETVENSKKFKLFDWLPHNSLHGFTAEILR